LNVKAANMQKKGRSKSRSRSESLSRPIVKKPLTPPRILVAGFLVAIVIGTILLALPIASVGTPLDPVSALFTATSAICITGLTVVDTGTELSLFGQVVVLVLVQVGGLGIATVSTLVALLLGRSIGLRNRLLIRETFHNITMAGLVRLTRYIIGVTLVCELCGAAVLAVRWWSALGPKALWWGLFHAVSAFNNAGFTLTGGYRSLAPFAGDVVVNLVVAFLFIAGGLGFFVLAELTDRKRLHLSLHSRIVIYISALLTLVGFIFILALEWSNPATLGALPPAGRPLAALFQSLSPRTAGFNTVSVSGMHQATLVLLMFYMFVGASPGGTGGGIKTTTLASVGAYVVAIIKNKDDPEIFRRRITSGAVRKALAVAALSAFCLVIFVMLLTVIDGERFAFHEILFETVSAFGTAGLSMGITSSLSDAGRLLLAVVIFIGRIGPLTLAAALTEPDPRHAVRYVSEPVIIG